MSYNFATEMVYVRQLSQAVDKRDMLGTADALVQLVGTLNTSSKAIGQQVKHPADAIAAGDWQATARAATLIVEALRGKMTVDAPSFEQAPHPENIRPINDLLAKLKAAGK